MGVLTRLPARLPGWARRLAQLIEERRDTPFAWGAHDCCTWAADAVQALTGEDPAAAWRGTYHTAWGALRVLRREGGIPGLAQRAGMLPCAAALARRGDLGEFTGRWGLPGVAVFCGLAWAAPGKHGLVFHGPERITQAWRVG